MKPKDIQRLHTLPLGWQGLVEELVEDILALEKRYSIEVSVSDAKEKWGTMVIYADGVTEEAWDTWYEIAGRYEELSISTCVSCGKTTNRRRRGYPLCGVCAAK